MNSSVTLAISSLYGEGGWGGDAKVVVFDPMWQLKEFWQDRNERKHIVQLCGPRVSYFLSHRIVTFFECMICGKLTFQCTRNGTQNFYIVQGLSGTPLLFSVRYLSNICFENMLQKNKTSIIQNLSHDSGNWLVLSKIYIYIYILPARVPMKYISG